MPSQKYPEGHFIGQGMGIGVAIGIALGVAFGIAIGKPAFYGIGIPIGVAIGSGIGTSWEEKAKKEGKIRPITANEKNQKHIRYLAGFLIGTVLLLLVLALYFFM